MGSVEGSGEGLDAEHHLADASSDQRSPITPQVTHLGYRR